jgi:hypothetical protein
MFSIGNFFPLSPSDKKGFATSDRKNQMKATAEDFSKRDEKKKKKR